MCEPARQFRDQWLTAFPWLCFEEGKMFCMVCTSQDGTTGQFVDGSTSFHTHSLTKHAERYMYTCSCVPYTCIMPMLSKNCSSQHNSCMHTLSGHTSRAEQSVMSRLAVLFRNAHAIAKAGRPFTDMEWMCALDEKKGLDVGALYRTDKKCCEFIHYIAEEQRVGLQQKLQSNNFFSIMVDGTTDSSVSDAEIIYIRYTSTLLAQILLLAYMHRQAVKGVVSVHFLAYVNITRGTADHILNAIVLALEKGLQMTKQTIFTKLVGFGSDGASVMTGCKSGVSTRLKGEQPLLFTLHCMAHRLELGFKGIIGANSFMSTFTELLFAIYNFYHSSALNRENLKSSCAAAGVKFLAPSRVGGTRWLPHTMLALKKLWNIYPALMQHFEQVRTLRWHCKASKVVSYNHFFSCPLQQVQVCLQIARPKQRAF